MGALGKKFSAMSSDDIVGMELGPMAPMAAKFGSGNGLMKKLDQVLMMNGPDVSGGGRSSRAVLAPRSAGAVSSFLDGEAGKPAAKVRDSKRDGLHMVSDDDKEESGGDAEEGSKIARGEDEEEDDGKIPPPGKDGEDYRKTKADRDALAEKLKGKKLHPVSPEILGRIQKISSIMAEHEDSFGALASSETWRDVHDLFSNVKGILISVSSFHRNYFVFSLISSERKTFGIICFAAKTERSFRSERISSINAEEVV